MGKKITFRLTYANGNVATRTLTISALANSDVAARCVGSMAETYREMDGVSDVEVLG